MRLLLLGVIARVSGDDWFAELPPLAHHNSNQTLVLRFPALRADDDLFQYSQKFFALAVDNSTGHEPAGT